MQNAAYQLLAKEFMDLWQKQISSVISDKQFIQSMLEMFQSAQNGAHDHKRHAAASHAADASDANHGVLDEFAFRLAMCEKRLAVLERQPKKTAKRSAATGGKRRSAKPRA
jgi:hypothetical protein